MSETGMAAGRPLGLPSHPLVFQAQHRRLTHVTVKTTKLEGARGQCFLETYYLPGTHLNTLYGLSYLILIKTP